MPDERSVATDDGERDAADKKICSPFAAPIFLALL